MSGAAEALDEAWTYRADEYVTALRFATDGRRIAIGDAAGRIAVLDAADGTVLARHEADSRGVLAVDWRPAIARDGPPDFAVGGQSGVVRCYGAKGLEAEAALDGDWIEQLAWHPDGTRLVATQGRHVVLLDARGAGLGASPPLASTVTGLAWRAGGRQLVTACYGGVAVHDAASLAITRRFKWTGSMVSLALSPNDKVVACGCQDASVHFWRFADGHDAQMSGYPAKPKSLSFSADSRWLATGGAPDVIVWPFDGRGPEGRKPLTLSAHATPVTHVAYAPASPGLVSGDRDGLLCLWVPGAREAPLARRQLGRAVAGMAWGRDGDDERLAVADADGVVRGWTL